ncbi:hypothetical protein SAMN05216486_1233 [bacterium JGI 053]|nr:hypothetical protein SAMN05216486_1233 [bacterium JGI 053]
MNGLMRGLRGAVVLGAGLAIAGCSQLGTLGNVLGGVMQPGAGSGSAQVAGTVRYVDTQRQMLQVTTTNGQTGNVYFDNRTQVVYQQQNYPVTALEQGDEVQLQLQQDQQGNYYASYIMVTRSVTDNGGYNSNGGYNNGGYNNGGYNNGGMIQTEGRVGWIDYQRGQFQLVTSGRTYTVMMSNNVAASDVNRFRSLRQNTYVRVQGQMVGNNQNQLQLTRFY